MKMRTALPRISGEKSFQKRVMKRYMSVFGPPLDDVRAGWIFLTLEGQTDLADLLGKVRRGRKPCYEDGKSGQNEDDGRRQCSFEPLFFRHRK